MITPTYSRSTFVSEVERYGSDQISRFLIGAIAFFFLLRYAKHLYSIFILVAFRLKTSMELIKRAPFPGLHFNTVRAIWQASGGISVLGFLFTCDSRVWTFPSNSLILSSFFWDSAWASCRALNSSSNCNRKRHTVRLCTHKDADRCGHVHRSWRAAGFLGERLQGALADARTRRLELAGRFLFMALVAVEPCCPSSLFWA